MPAIKETKYIWFDGKMVPWKKAHVHVLTHGLNYGTSIFEGVRCYPQEHGGRALFRLREHVRRFFDSARLMEMDLEYNPVDIEHAIRELIRINKLRDAYVRPLAFFGYGNMGLDTAGSPVSLALAAIPFEAYLGPDAQDNGARICFASIGRDAPNTHLIQGKIGGNYVNSVLIKREARRLGFDEGLAFDHSGYVSECSGENVFLVKGGVLMTPRLGHGFLPGFTRHCVMTIAHDLSIPVAETSISREMVILADEMFMTGTYAEINPVVEVSGQKIGNGKPGSVTKNIRGRYNAIATGKEQDTYDWLTFVD